MLTRKVVLVSVVALLAAGCALMPRAERPEGPFEIVLFATTDTRAELAPCG